VLLMPSAMGLTPAYLRTASELANLGYVTLAADMYGDGAYFTDVAQAKPPTAALLADPQRLRSRALAWLDALAAHPRVDAAHIGAIGYCFGGRNVLEIARSGADVKVVVSFHGNLTTALPAAKGAVKACVVVYAGALDPFAPLTDIETLRAEMAAADARFHLTVFSDVEHAFTTEPTGAPTLPGRKYDPMAHTASWTGALAYLDRLVKAAPAKAA
jgi:dienelactone hydrolase